eukprot:g1339.t1
MPVYTSIYVEWLINVPILLVLAGSCALHRTVREVKRPLIITPLGVHAGLVQLLVKILRYSNVGEDMWVAMWLCTL